MIVPDEPKYVGVCSEKPNRTSRVYFLTRYLLEEKGTELTLYELETRGEGIMRDVVDVKVLAEPQEIVRYDKEVDIHNRAELVEIAHMLCGDGVNTVVFKGMDGHITFVHEPDIDQILNIEVYDVVPPHPSMLVYWLSKLKEAGAFNDVMVRFIPRLVNLKQLESPHTVFPCSASGLSPPFLDRDRLKAPVKLIGCDTGREVMRAMYPHIPHTVESFCPFSTELYAPSGPFIARCCRRERCGPARIGGHVGYIVHWGVHQCELIEAVHTLVKEV
ncbi:DUF7714 family protein [Methermicoccus shengliensis]|uniref:Uncharacterized protein n=1 Tax=Methermicoccus shengliensis TaxID=660064 RepID=A0A832RY02_9EURY|nr:hypothetical protein [Methermicoccus shengliensis]HIH70283.1 hypothetical protein [Methermicoccus shengliensis]